MINPQFGAKSATMRTTVGTRYFSYAGSGFADTNVWRAQVAVNGTVGNLTATITVAPGAGITHTFTLYVNNTATTVTCAISDDATSASDTTHFEAVNAGDDVSWQCVTSGGTAAASTLVLGNTFDSDTDTESTLVGSTNAAINADSYRNMGGHVGNATTEANVSDIAPMAFTLDKLYVRVAGPPGAGTSWDATLYKNGNPTSVTCQIADTATTCTDPTNSETFVAGDTLSMFFDATGAVVNRQMNWGLRIVPTVQGEYPLFETRAGTISTVGTQYANIYGSGSGFSNEATALYYSPVAFTLRDLTAYFEPAPGVGNSWTLKTRIGGFDGNSSVLVQDTDQFEQDTVNTDSIAYGDIINLSTTPVSGPDAVTYSKFASVAFIDPTPAGNEWYIAFV